MHLINMLASSHILLFKLNKSAQHNSHFVVLNSSHVMAGYLSGQHRHRTILHWHRMFWLEWTALHGLVALSQGH